VLWWAPCDTRWCQVAVPPGFPSREETEGETEEEMVARWVDEDWAIDLEREIELSPDDEPNME